MKRSLEGGAWMDCGGLVGDLWFCALAPGLLSHYTGSL